MKVYIASSWKNQHAVEMLTALLREEGHEVISWVENNYGENHNHVTKKFDFETWVNSKESMQSFIFDTDGAMSCDVLIYVGPAGMDAAAECGMAYGKGVPIIGLYAKGEGFGLMRKMMRTWVSRFTEIITELKTLADLKMQLSHTNINAWKEAYNKEMRLQTNSPNVDFANAKDDATWLHENMGDTVEQAKEDELAYWTE